MSRCVICGNGFHEEWGNGTTNTSSLESSMLKVSYHIAFTEAPSVTVSQNYNETGVSACLQTFNILKDSFQVNAKNANSSAYNPRSFK